ncbi:MAG: substrate-binding domain-containing protein [Rhizobiales bacterium]|nr:substrate-binding domain-containing protein [Hyphomicrobiales bacterium]
MTDTVKVVTTVAMQAVLEQLEPQFSEATGFGIEMAFGPPARATEMVLKGETADIVMTTPEGVTELATAGLVDASTSRVVVSMLMGAAVRAGAPKPDIGTVEAFKTAVLAAKSVTYANPELGSPSARHFLKIAEQLGILDEVKAKSLVSSGLIARHVAAGEADMAIQQLSELRAVEGVEVIGQFPREIQNIVPLAAAIHTDSRHRDQAAELIRLIASPATRPLIEDAGLLPAD